MSSLQLWTYLIVGLTFAAYIYIGYTNRVRDTKGFYVAGQGVPAIANGAATAADWMSAASFISMAGLISFMGYDGSMYLMGWTGGYVLLALLLAPYLRKFGKYTVPDFVGDRYYSQFARFVAAIATVIVSLTYVAGQMRGVGIVFSRFLNVNITLGIVIGMAIVAVFAVLGGMKGITWTQVAQYSILIVAYLIPAIAISLQLGLNPIPQLAFTFNDIVPQLNELQLELGFEEYTKPFVDRTFLNMLCITIALMFGTAGLPHVITRFYTVPNVRAARYSAGWALLFIALLYTTAPAIAAFARFNLLTTLDGAQIASQAEGEPTILLDGDGNEIEWATGWQKTGLLSFTDTNDDGAISMRAVEADKLGVFEEATINRDIMVLANPEIANLAPFIIALVAAGGLAAALSTASGLLLAMSSAVSHDIYYRLINPKASEANRLVAGRIAIFLAIVLAGYLGYANIGFVGEVVAIAFGLAAASNFPPILMGIFDKRMNKQGAIAGLLTGLLFTFGMVLMMKSHKIFGTAEPMLESFLTLQAEGIGTIGMILNFVVAYFVSRATPPPPQEIVDMVENVRVPRGAGAASVH